ncbi:MAG: Asp-tRNA(Asn)/Glu-tRNA(Gln) amidotransferase subunit GatA [Phycisphaerales bacterium]|nr:MAG: Asp-tRNA(Asn)/Glu-tRNA(Gln) amidotransferase subunit GatA [Phycisphaerales bacterium]
MNLVETAQAIRNKELSAVDAVRQSLDAIARHDGKYRAFVQVDGDRALSRAREVDEALGRGAPVGPLAGVPVGIKDNMCTRFGRTTCASRILHNFEAPYDAHAVERLERAGAIIVGKTNLDEFAMGSSTENSSVQQTLNPWDPRRVPGGSSGGSATAVALGMVPGALGSDTGGSIRQPASFCGVVGLKPTYGRVSRHGLVAFASSLDQIGPLARTAADAALLLSVIAGYDPRDSTSVDEQVPEYEAGLDRPLRGLRIGIAPEYFSEGLDDPVRSAVEAALDVYRKHGAVVSEIRLPHTRYAIACYYLVATAEASSNLARYDGVHYGHRTEGIDDVIELYSASRRDGFGPEVKRRIMLGTYALSSGYYDAYYLKALKVRTLLRRDFERAFETVDVIASPVAPTTAFALGEKTDNPLAMYLADVYTTSVNLAGVPGISIPCGFDGAGLPVGLQLIGPPFAEDTLLAAAHQFQLVTDHHTRAAV